MARDQVVVRQFIERRPRPRNPYGKGLFMLVSLGGLGELDARLADKTIGMQAMRVLLAMLGCVEYGNRVQKSQKELAAHLAMSPSEVSKASKRLVDCGFIERLPNRRGWYRIDPRFGWKGDVESLSAAQVRLSASS